MTGGNVLPQLPLFDPPRQKHFRAAVAKVIRQIKALHSLSNVMLAEEIGCCADTVSNAENENNDLSAVLLLRIAYRFGERAIDPVRELYLRELNAPLGIEGHSAAIKHHAAELARLAEEAMA